VPNNVWAGTTIENREALKLRLPLLLSIDTPNRWINFEPLLEDVSEGLSLKGIKWACVGGETGPNYRPFRIEWAYKLYMIAQRDQVTFWFEGGNGENESRRQRGNAFPRDRPQVHSAWSEREQTILFNSDRNNVGSVT
jgi:protein gp37